jgi:hypothetical protein
MEVDVRGPTKKEQVMGRTLRYETPHPQICIRCGTSITDRGRYVVGIVSAFGDKFHVKKVGVTVFGNELKEFPIDSWGIDDGLGCEVGGCRRLDALLFSPWPGFSRP